MKIAQITDLHIDLDGEYPFNIDVRKNFLDILELVVKEAPDHLVVTGDFCLEDGLEEIYLWIRSPLELLPFSYDIIAGNHDNSVIMANTFELEHLLKDDEFYFAKKIGRTHCLFLDTSKGFHSDNQLKWIKRQLKSNTADLVVFMHHPPLESNVPFMDKKYPLQDMEAIQKIFLNYPHNITVFSGHYHVEKTVIHKNITLMITPACYFQINQNTDEFSVDHHRIGMRLIELDGGMICSTVRYLDGNSVA